MFSASAPRPFPTVTTSHSKKSLALWHFQTVTPEKRVTARNRLKPAKNLGCDVVTVSHTPRMAVQPKGAI